MGDTFTATMRVISVLCLLVVAATAFPTSEFCRHRVDSKDNKCYEGCAAETFKSPGLIQLGECWHAYSVVDSESTIEQCNDGKTNVKYCSGGNLRAVNVTMKVKAKALNFMATPPCCEGACTTAGEEKYWSIASGIFGKKHCGECCMDPKKYNLFHFFEKNLTKSATDSPCEGFGYTKYDSTVTHGFGPVSMTLDLYDAPAVETTSVDEVDTAGNTFGQFWNKAFAPQGVFNHVYHHEDAADKQCFQADFPTSCDFTQCAPMAGVETKGSCPDKYNVKKSKRDEIVCRDGSNIKYCTYMNKIDVVVSTFGIGAGENAFVSAVNATAKQCTTSDDCPCSYCMNDSSKKAPFMCHDPLPGVCCKTDKDCPNSYCVNYHGPPPYLCHSH